MELIDASLLKKIDEGRYREVYSDGQQCFKFLKMHLVKTYGEHEVVYPLRLYTLFKFGIRDINVYELTIYQKMRFALPLFTNNVASLSRLQESTRGPVLVGKLITNVDGSVAQPLKAYGCVNDERFWERLHTVCFFLEQKGFPYFGLSDQNVVVRKTLDGVEPVIVDLKRIGGQMLPFQPWLHFRYIRRAKIQRKLEYLCQRYR
jgi:hypothetical protein